jgi:methylthioribulose-1-phosphate dehydratase
VLPSLRVTEPLDAAIEALIAFGRYAAGRDWVAATSGNFSCRVDEARVVLTRSGRDKGALTPDDFLVASPGGPPPPAASAEAPLHLARYRHDPAVRAVLHVHSRAATIVSRRRCADGRVLLEGWEMQKAFAGVTTHEAKLELPIYPNSQDIDALVAIAQPRPPVPGFLLAGHGLYAWGRSVDEARRHVEAFDFLLACILEEGRT